MSRGVGRQCDSARCSPTCPTLIVRCERFICVDCLIRAVGQELLILLMHRSTVARSYFSPLAMQESP